MGRIDEIFAAARRERRGLLMPFLTAGDPSLDVTLELVAALERAGAAAVEIGIPFSDPIADGPVIAGSMHEALLRGTTPEAIFGAFGGAFGETDATHARSSAARQPAASDAAADRTRSPRMARLAMVSVSIVERMGTRAFVEQAAASGFDGLIVPDADLLASDRLSEACAEADLACAFLVAPTSTPARVAEIVRRCRGFVYLLARAGVTGDGDGPRGIAHAAKARTAASNDSAERRQVEPSRSAAEASGVATIARQVGVIRSVDPAIPIAAGFGIATPEHVAATVAHVDAAIVGTALVRRIRDAVASGADPVAEAERFVAALVAAAEAGAAAAAAQTHAPHSPA